MSHEWIELVDPQTTKPFYANIKTGSCTWEKPNGISFKGNSNHNVEWWELYDKKHEMPYYYNTKTKFTDWIRPQGVEIISLIKLQQQTILKNVSRNSIIKYEVRNEDIFDNEEINNIKNEEHKRLSIIVEDSVLNPPDSTPVNFNGTPSPHSQILPVSMKFEQYKRLSSEIFTQIKTYGFDEYAKKNFMEHRRGLFRKKIPLESLLCWSKQSIRKPLLKSSRNYYKDALRCFSLIQRILGDKNSNSNLNDVQKLLDIGLNNANIRDEIYCQVCKQLNKNPNFGHIVLGWKLMSVLVIAFPPSRDFEEYLKCFIEKYTHSSWTIHLIKDTLGESKSGNYQKKESMNKDDINSTSQHLHKLKRSFTIHNSIRRQNDSLNRTNTNESTRNRYHRGRSYSFSNTYSYKSKEEKENDNDNIFIPKINEEEEKENNNTDKDNKDDKNKNKNKNNDKDKDKDKDKSEISEDDERIKTIQILSQHCYRKLAKTCIVGPRGKTLSLKEIEQRMNAAFHFSYFGETLEDIMEQQRKNEVSDLNVPAIMVFLANSILELNGSQTEGIFRVPGDVDSISELRYQVEKKNFNLNGCTDPNVPASLLKLWLRELAEPVIPAYAYDECIEIGKKECTQDASVLARELIESLPEINRLVIHYMTDFLKVIAKPENQKFTKMTLANLAMVFAPNFLRCPSENPQVIFENTKYEQAFIRILITY